MHMAYKGKEKQYAYAKESKREGSKVTTSSIYLGKVADRELGVLYKPERGFFTFLFLCNRFIFFLQKC